MASDEGPQKDWVVARKARRWAVLFFLASALLTGWFLVVIQGETQGWTDNPGSWAGLPTDVWAFLAGAVSVVALVMILALLMRREIPASTYRVDDDGRLE